MRSVCLSALSTLAPGVSSDWSGGAALTQASVQPQRPWRNDWFDARRALPGIRHRYLNDATRFGLAAALRCRSQVLDDTADEHRGIFVGTSVADHAVRQDFDLATLRDGADGLNTVAAPNMSANIAAAHVAIVCRGRAFSTTLTAAGLGAAQAIVIAVISRVWTTLVEVLPALVLLAIRRGRNAAKGGAESTAHS